MSSERLTLPQLIRRWAHEQPDKPFVVTEDDALTYAQLERASGAVAGWFAAAGVGKGTRVGLLMPNGTAWPVVALGASRAGATVVPLSTLLRPPELAAHLHTAGVEHLVIVATFRGRDYLADLAAISPELAPGEGLFVAALPRLRSITVWDDGRPDQPPEDPSREFLDALDAAIRPADDLAIIFTSGSRGLPKGVIHTHGGALGATEAGLDARRLGRDDRLYIPMPFFWVGGFGTGLLSTLIAGATLLTEAQPQPERTLPFLERERVTLFRGWPDQAVALAQHPRFATTDLGSLRAGSLDAVLPADLRAAPGTPPNLLGMTESFGPYCSDRLDRAVPAGKEGSCGRPFAGIEVRIVDVETRAPVAPDVVGEIELRGPNMMRGICGRTRSEVFTEDGFYPTGDLGRLDADGYLFLTGRLDDMFKVRGATVYPSEVEGALRTIAGVQRAFVVDVVRDGTPEVGAAVVLAPGNASTVADLDREARARLSSFKVPMHWAIVDDLPVMATGKLDKPALQRMFETAEATARTHDR